MMTIQVLFVEDDIDFGYMLKQYLELDGFSVHWIQDLKDVSFQKNDLAHFHIAVLDVMMPYQDGFSLAKEIRSIRSDLPIFFLTAKNQQIDRLTGLKIGAYDYIAKPCDPEELTIRLKNTVTRTYKTKLDDAISIGTYVFYPSSLLLDHPMARIRLTEREAALLLFLHEHHDQVLRRDKILDSIWPENDFFSGRSMDVFVSKLRKYLRYDSSLKITSIRGIGFDIQLGSLDFRDSKQEKEL